MIKSASIEGEFYALRRGFPGLSMENHEKNRIQFSESSQIFATTVCQLSKRDVCQHQARFSALEHCPGRVEGGRRNASRPGARAHNTLTANG